MSKKNKSDIFISHASEDKQEFVKPLAVLLVRLGVDVWYDEFSLEAGDSLSRAIDKGLGSCRLGILVISKAFIRKKWPEYEMRGLIAREMAGRKKRIIPIWHGINHKEIISFSPTLADKLALNTSTHSLEEIAWNILEIVRPDIADKLKWRLHYLEMIEGGTQIVPLSQLKIDNRIIHDTLPENWLVRIKSIHMMLKDIDKRSLTKRINDFRRERTPEKEIEVWERIAIAYKSLTENEDLSFEQKQKIYIALVFTLSPVIGKEFPIEESILRMAENALNNVVPEIKDEE